MDPQQFFKRVTGLVDPGLLQTKRVAVIGLGSGGCRVAAELGRLGVQLLLVERPDERLEEHNIVRHLLGYDSLGKLKLTEMVRHIRNLNPAVSLTPCSLDVLDQDDSCFELLSQWGPDVLAVCTDSEPSKHAINQVAFRLGIPQTGGAVYDGGIGGEVYRTRPGAACYGCIAAQLQLQPLPPKHHGVMDYSNPENPETPATCALNLDIEQIAVLQTRVTLELLLREGPGLLGLPQGVNLFVFANRLMPGPFARPLHCEFFRVPRRRDCLFCGPGTDDLEREAGRILGALQNGSPDHSLK